MKEILVAITFENAQKLSPFFTKEQFDGKLLKLVPGQNGWEFVLRNDKRQ